MYEKGRNQTDTLSRQLRRRRLAFGLSLSDVASTRGDLVRDAFPLRTRLDPFRDVYASQTRRRFRTISIFCRKSTGASRLNTYHILKSLTYFDDAETEPMPRMRVPFNWAECKAFFVREARAIVLA